MAGFTKGPWAFWDECGSTPDNSCTPWGGAGELTQEIYNAEGKHIGEVVLTVCEKVLATNQACDNCSNDGKPCAGVLRVSRENALLIAAAPDLFEALEPLEWAGPGETCLSCKRSKSSGHAKSCPVAKALGKALGEISEVSFQSKG
ncbi:hypothetical protein JCM15519_07050 [Fundidesulfovibrio butyratiphilus]